MVSFSVENKSQFNYTREHALKAFIAPRQTSNSPVTSLFLCRVFTDKCRSASALSGRKQEPTYYSTSANKDTKLAHESTFEREPPH